MILCVKRILTTEFGAVDLSQLEYGAITTSLKSVVSHERKQIPKWRDETECPLKGGRVPNRKMAIFLFVTPCVLKNYQLA